MIIYSIKCLSTVYTERVCRFYRRIVPMDSTINCFSRHEHYLSNRSTEAKEKKSSRFFYSEKLDLKPLVN